MQPTIELITLQTYLISKGKTMIDRGEYKETSEVLSIIAQLWGEANKKEQEYIEKLIAGTVYSTAVDSW